MSSYHYPEPAADTKREHRARWFEYTGRIVDGKPERIPCKSSIIGTSIYGYDAVCACGGWESRIGGGLRHAVADAVAQHKSDVQYDKDNGTNISGMFPAN